MTKPREEKELGGVLDFMRVIWALDHGLQRMSKRLEGDLGVTGPQRLVLRIVGRWPGITAGDLARTLHVHPSTLTGVLRRLEARGLVAREPDPSDGRRALLRLSSKGRRVDVSQHGTVEAVVRRVLTKTPRSRAHATREVLESLVSHLERELAR
jgi:MarR family transcriptional regulator, organic hydroperoxide resistance regulator